MKKFLVFLFFAMFLVSMAGTARAAPLITNGTFQTGNLAPWVTTGSVQNASASVFFELQGMDDRFALLGENLNNGTSSLSQTFTAPAANTFNVGFNWAFDFADIDVLNSDSFVSLLDDSGTHFSITMQDIGTGFINVGTSHALFQDSFDVTGFLGGPVTIAFNLNESPGSTFSKAGIDNVSVVAGNPPVVPIPSTLLLFGSGLVGLIGWKRRTMKV